MRIAIEVPRPPLVHVLLATIVIAPALICDPTERTRRCGTISLAPSLEAVPEPADDMVFDPSGHPDAREWPRGMVIKPPAIDPGIQLTISKPHPVDILLSALGLPFTVPTTSDASSLL